MNLDIIKCIPIHEQMPKELKECYKYVTLQVQGALPSIMLHAGATPSVVWYFYFTTLEFFYFVEDARYLSFCMVAAFDC